MRSVVIFGATSAIATACARQFAARGDSLYLVARSAEKLEVLKDDLSARGAGKVVCRSCDLNRVEEHEALCREIQSSIGGIDIAFIAYGVLGDQKAGQLSMEETKSIFHTNFFSVVSLLTFLANDFEAKRSGTIAVISSVAGDRGRQSNYLYGASKGALDVFLEGLRNRLFPAGVHVLTIKPGFVDTPMTAHIKKGPLFAKPDAVARDIVRALKWKFNTVYTPWFWWPIMTIIRSIPETLFKRLKL